MAGRSRPVVVEGRWRWAALPSGATASGTARSRGRRWKVGTVVVRLELGAEWLVIDTVGISDGPEDLGCDPGSRACRRPKGSPTRSSPGAPNRGGGLLASEPGLATSTHDLRLRV